MDRNGISCLSSFLTFMAILVMFASGVLNYLSITNRNHLFQHQRIQVSLVNEWQISGLEALKNSTFSVTTKEYSQIPMELLSVSNGNQFKNGAFTPKNVELTEFYFRLPHIVQRPTMPAWLPHRTYTLL